MYIYYCDDYHHDAFSTPTTLATSTPANYFQDGRAGTQMSAWHGSAIPVDIMRANVITRGRCHLRFAESGQLTVPRTRTNYEDRSFAVHGAVVWNSSSRSLSAEHFTASVQEMTENVPVLG